MDWTDLTDGLLLLPIDADELGATVLHPVWTATNIDGTYFAADCSGWNSTMSFGMTGDSQSTTTTWTEGVGEGCNQERGLYCFQQ